MGRHPSGISKPKASQMVIWSPTNGVMNLRCPSCSMQRMVCISSSMDAIDGKAFASSGFVSRICLMYDARISATKQMNILPCLDDSVHTRRRSSPRGPFCSMKVFSCSSRIPYRLFASIGSRSRPRVLLAKNPLVSVAFLTASLSTSKERTLPLFQKAIFMKLFSFLKVSRSSLGTGFPASKTAWTTSVCVVMAI